jgi:sterol desaturase/sphingolipid hydroxylase (fatty acid hydroxylase superfamily)
LSALHPQKVFRKEIGVDIGYYFLNSLAVAFALAGPLSIVAMVVRHAIPSGVIATTAAWPFWLRACAALVAGEIGYYWGHRMTHEIPFLWRFRAVHHSAEHLDCLVSPRQHPIDVKFVRMCMLTPLLAFGLVNPMKMSDGLIPAILLITGGMWNFFVHANFRWRLGPIEWLISTPGFHHWHHTNDRRRDCNYASMLPWVDRIFGTHFLPKQWPERYGIDEPMPSSLGRQLIQPLQPPPLAARSAEGADAPRRS